MNLVINFCKSRAHADNLQQPSNINENVPILIVAPHIRVVQPSTVYTARASGTLPGGAGGGVSQRDLLFVAQLDVARSCLLSRGVRRSQAFTHRLAKWDLTTSPEPQEEQGTAVFADEVSLCSGRACRVGCAAQRCGSWNCPG